MKFLRYCGSMLHLCEFVDIVIKVKSNNNGKNGIALGGSEYVVARQMINLNHALIEKRPHVDEHISEI